MPTVMEKIRRGNADLMKSLYESCKSDVRFLCGALLGEESAADRATADVFRSVWEGIFSGKINSQEEFSDYAQSRAVSYCKASIGKRNSKAFRVPLNKNFLGAGYDAEKMNFSGELLEVVLKNLPELHRFIYVLHGGCNYTKEKLAKLFNMNGELIQLALEAEEANVERIMAAAAKKMKMPVAMSVEQFHERLRERKHTMPVPQTVDMRVMINIDHICEPILERKKKQRRKYAVLAGGAVLAVCVLVGIAFALGRGNAADGEEDEIADNSDTDDAEDSSDGYDFEIYANYYADIEIQDYGTITVALDGDAAPETVANFVSLAESGFYDGLTFHRIMEGFMMQGGDPNGDGTGGSEETITGEFTDNGFENALSHVRGAISMARSDDYDSASSQFFIVHEDSTSLDGAYAVFGYVTEGMEVVDAVCEAAEPTDDNGTIVAEEQPVIVSIAIRAAEDTAEE